MFAVVYIFLFFLITVLCLLLFIFSFAFESLCYVCCCLYFPFLSDHCVMFAVFFYRLKDRLSPHRQYSAQTLRVSEMCDIHSGRLFLLAYHFQSAATFVMN